MDRSHRHFFGEHGSCALQDCYPARDVCYDLRRYLPRINSSVGGRDQGVSDTAKEIGQQEVYKSFFAVPFMSNDKMA